MEAKQIRLFLASDASTTLAALGYTSQIWKALTIKREM